jgi:electron transport complex protein RnfD
LLGGAYLIIRKVISIRIPAAYLGSVAVLTLIFHKTDAPLQWMLYSLLSGGVMLGAIFMATDYATSPATARGQIIFGIGCGILTVIFRYFGIFPEGVTYAILLMNALVWVIDRYTAPRRFGVRKGGAAQ